MSGGGSGMVRRLMIRTAIAVVAAGAAAALFSLREADSYRSRVLLVMTRSPFDQIESVEGNVAAANDPKWPVNLLKLRVLEAVSMPESYRLPQRPAGEKGWSSGLSLPDYATLFTSEEVANRLLEPIRTFYKEKGIDENGLSVAGIQGMLDVRTKILLQTANEVVYQEVVELNLTAGNPQVASELANIWAETCVAFADEVRGIRREDADAFIQASLDRFRGERDAAREGLESLAREANPDGLMQRLAALEQAATQSTLEKSRMTMEISRLEGELGALQKELEATPATNAEAGNVLNPAYTEIDVKRATVASTLAGVQEARGALEHEQGELESTLAALREKAAQVTSERRAREAQAATAEEQIKQLDSAAFASADTGPAFRIASRAVAPGSKAGPRRSLIVAVAMFVAAVAVWIHFFGMYALRRYAQTLEPETDA